LPLRECRAALKASVENTCTRLAAVRRVVWIRRPTTPELLRHAQRKRQRRLQRK
jgi:hypothetical protein